MNYKDISKENLDTHVSRIIDICDDIPMDKVTILTGGNALGKSVIRKQLCFYVAEKKDVDRNKSVCSTSMQLRTEQKPEFGALSSCMHDTPWCSTSESTIRLLKNLINQAENRFIVIDELEIGMSREVQVGTCIMLNKLIPEILKKNYGILVITHSETIVKNLNHDNFINIEGMTENEWLNREIVAVDPEDLEKWANELFKAIKNRESEK